jgi:hypothetical protein
MLIVCPRVLGAVPATLCVRRAFDKPGDPTSRRWTWAAEPAFLDDEGTREIEKTAILPGAAGTTFLDGSGHSGRFCFLAANASAAHRRLLASRPRPEAAGDQGSFERYTLPAMVLCTPVPATCPGSARRRPGRRERDIVRT